MSLQEFHDWEKFSLLEPFLPERVDIAGAQVTTMLANINMPRGHRPKTLSDFMIVEHMLRRSEMQDEDAREHDLMKRVIIGLGGKIA